MRRLATLLVLTCVAPAFAQTTQPASSYPALQKLLASLKAENAALKQNNESLQKRVAELEGQVAALKPSLKSERRSQAIDAKQAKDVNILQLQAGPDELKGKVARLPGCYFERFAGDQLIYFTAEPGAREKWLVFSVRDSSGNSIGYIYADKRKWAEAIAGNGGKKPADFTIRLTDQAYRPETIVAELIDFKEQ